MLVAKWIAFVVTGSSVIFSDAAESVVHIVAVWFAWYALRITTKPPDEEHPYGHDKISFMSAGVEGGLICIAAVVIIVSAVQKLIEGPQLQRLDVGIGITAGAAIVNLVLGLYLIRTGKRTRTLVVEANGRHVMTDVWTSAGAVGGLVLAMVTDMYWLDPVMAMLFGANIIREGFGLLTISVKGLMDTADPVLLARTQQIITEYCDTNRCSFHRLRLRHSGDTIHIDYHLTVSDDLRMQDAHALATQLEERIRASFEVTTEVFTHLESVTQPEGHV
jgi:cation diffusion facilitator family transporter